MSLTDCRLIDLPKISEKRGNLTFIESSNQIPFKIERVFYIYDIPSGETRGAHANKLVEEFVICVSGSLDVKLDDGLDKATVHLNRPFKGLYIPPLTWCNMENFAPGTVYVVLASTKFDNGDYVRDYDEFTELASRHRV
jgi:dTDP-4-dehydrorhamnose 3,5-epimerase-like enzyme